MVLYEFKKNNLIDIRKQEFNTSSSSKLDNLLELALNSPEERELWQEVFLKAMQESRLDIVREAVEHLRKKDILYEAYFSVIDGRPADVFKLLKGRRDPAANSVLAWAFYWTDSSHAAAALWCGSQNIEEHKLGKAFLNFLNDNLIKQDEKLIMSELLELESSSDPKIVSVSADILYALFMNKADYSNALKHSRKAESILHKNSRIKYMMATALLELGDIKLAKDKVNEILENEPRNAFALELLGDILISEEKFDKAKIAFQRAIDIEPSSTKARNSLAFILLSEGKKDEAKKHWELVLELDEENTEALENLAEYYFHLQKYQVAMHYFNQLEEIDYHPEPDEELQMYYEDLCKASCEYLWRSTQDSFKNNIALTAEHYIYRARQKFPANDKFKIYDVKRLMSETGEKLRISAVKAEKILDGVLKSNPNFEEAIIEKAILHVLMGRLHNALKLAENLVRLENGCALYYKLIGIIYFAMGRSDEADKNFQIALNIMENYNEIDSKDNRFEEWFSLIFLFDKVRNYETADHIFRNHLLGIFDSFNILILYCKNLMRLERFEEAYSIMNNVIVGYAIDGADEKYDYDEDEMWDHFAQMDSSDDIEMLSKMSMSKKIVDNIDEVYLCLGFSAIFNGDYKTFEDNIKSLRKFTKSFDKKGFNYYFREIKEFVDKAIQHIESDSELADKKRKNLIKLISPFVVEKTDTIEDILLTSQELIKIL